jgi:hypothetical protein
VINDGTTAFTTTLRTATNATANASYILPTAIGSNTNVLAIQNATTGQLVWSATGTGDITRAGTNQVVTGDIRFQSTGAANVGLVLRNNAGTYATTFNMSSTGTPATTYITTFPAATGTVALLEASQSWSGAQVFTGGVTINTTALSVASAATFSSAGSTTAAQLTFGGATNNWINFAQIGFNIPSLTTRSSGTKIVLWNSLSASLLDNAIGYSSNGTWMSLATSTESLILYAPISSVVTNIFSVTGVGNMTMRGGTITMSTNTTAGNVTGSADNGIFSRNFINLGNAGGAAIPAAVGSSWGARSLGSRVIIQATSSTTQADMAIGYTTNSFWFSLFTATSGSTYDWYGAATKIMTLRGDGILNLPTSAGRIQINSTQVVGTQIGGYGTPTGGNRTLSFAAVTQAEQVLAQLVADLKTHGLIG